MAKTKTKQDLDAKLAAIAKKYGRGVMHKASESVPVNRIPFLQPNLNRATEGGVPFGRFTAMSGDPNCLAANTVLNFQIRTVDGKMVNSKGGTIELLHERFHKLPGRRTAAYRSREPEYVFSLPSMNDEGRIQQNRVVDVVWSGMKSCVRISTKLGYSIDCSLDHRFFVGDGYVRAGDLTVGSTVYAHNNTVPNSCKPHVCRPETTVKYHPCGSRKRVNGYDYVRLPVARLALEAANNGLSIENYRARLNAGDLDGLEFLPRGIDVHHEDENPSNNDPSNLSTQTRSQHARIHALRDHNRLKFVVVLDEVVAIDHVGDVNTYDVEMQAPYRNFVAQHLVVHNSGKSRVALEIIAQAQQLPRSAEVVLIPRIAYHSALGDETSLKDEHRRRHMVMAERLSDELDWIRAAFPNGADALYVNAEAQFDPLWAAKIGVDLDRLMILESTTIEEIVDVMGSFYRDIPLHVVDSTSNASSLLSQKQEPGKSAGYGVDARQWKMCLRDSLAGTMEEGLGWDRERNMGILIHQMSTNVKSGAQQAVATRYMTFISRLSLRFSHGTFLYRHDGVLKDKKGAAIEEGRPPEADGREIFVKVDKSTVCRPFREAGLQWDYGKSNFVLLHDLAMAAINKGVVVISGSWYRVASEDKQIGQGLKSVYARLADDEEMRARLTCMLLDHTAEV